MNKLVSLGMVVALSFCASADMFYVDPTGGTVSSDDYDGTAETWQGGTVGPMKTLAAVAAKAGEVATKSNPCTIIALPGEYRKGVSNPEAIGTAETLNRVSVPQYVTLVSRDGRDKTFIIGAASDAPDATNGCGTNATRCVVGSGTVQGFTLTGGHTFSYVKAIASSGSKADGGAAYSATIVDCVVSNNFAYRGGGSAYATKNVRCVFRDNRVAFTGHNNQGGTSYNCLLVGGEAYSGTYYNCTFGKSSYPRGGDCYNSLILLKGSPNSETKCYRCYHLAGYNDYTKLDPECTVFESAADIMVDAEGRPTDAASPILNAGSETYYNKLSNAPTAKELDVEGLPRLMGGAVDIGCYERNPCDDFSALLSAQGAVTVTNVTPFVSSDREAQVVAVGTNQTLLATLNRFGESGLTTWKFFAEVKGSGALKICFGDAEDPHETVVEADGKVVVSYAAADSTGLKLVYEGTDGAAEVSRFANHRSVKIVADSEGVVVSGDFTAVGEYGIGAGETKTFTVARANNPAKFVRGIEVNGEFVDFNDYPDGKTFTVSGDDYYSGLEITTVYADSVNEWFVDAVNGNDETNCGYYANMAFKTLAKAARTAQNTGNIITALPGVYNEGGMYAASPGSSNRVVLADGVWLRSRDGAAVTAIEGKISNQKTNGIGTDSMRCAYLKGGAVISGFTMTKGRTNDELTNNNANGGAVYGGLCVDCVFTNNVGKNGGNAASSGKLLRCTFGPDPSGASAVYLSATLIDCVNNSGKTVRQNCTAYNTTFVSGGFVAGSNYPNKAYNCKFLSDAPTVCTLYRCYSNKAKGSNVTEEDGCKFSQTDEDLAYDPETCRPLKGSIAIDAANAEYYVRATNGWSKLWQSFIGTDYAGGQRVYNGKIDIGAGEYDWRGDFGKALAKKDVAVAVATANVTTNVTAGLDAPAGESLKLKIVLRTSGKVSFKVAADADATAVVTLNGVALTPSAGSLYEFEGEVGECEVEIAVTGEGTATVSDVILPKLGVLLLVR